MALSKIDTDGVSGLQASLTATTTVPSEGGAATTNLVQGLAKAWAYVNGQAATPVFFDSLNCSSLTDVSTGTQAPQLTNPFSNNYFAQPSSAHASGVSWCFSVYTGGKTTNQMYLSSVNTSGFAVDANPIEGTAHGDLA